MGRGQVRTLAKVGVPIRRGVARVDAIGGDGEMGGGRRLVGDYDRVGKGGRQMRGGS